MYQDLCVNMLNLALSFSDALDLASSELFQHQLRTAFVVWEISRAAQLPPETIERVFVAALLHDVGALSLEEKVAIQRSSSAYPEKHAILGEALLKQSSTFEPTAQIVRFHHKPWREWAASRDAAPMLESQIVLLADTLERSIDRRRYILHQEQELIARIGNLAGAELDPEVADLFRSLAAREDFWLDLVSPRLYSILLRNAPCRGREVQLAELKQISEMFRNMIDFRSRFTATHSSGVAASAAALARLFGLTEIEIEMIQVAGNLHDLGKLAIPNSILDKPDKLTKAEVATMRQHTYFTYSVLSTVAGIEQIAEWAAFHHERLDGSGYPFHLDAKKLNTGARILAVADTFTALAEDRPYRPGMPREQVVAILKSMESQSYTDSRVLGILEENYDQILALTMQAQTRAQEHFEREFAPYVAAQSNHAG